MLLPPHPPTYSRMFQHSKKEYATMQLCKRRKFSQILPQNCGDGRHNEPTVSFFFLAWRLILLGETLETDQLMECFSRWAPFFLLHRCPLNKATWGCCSDWEFWVKWWQALACFGWGGKGFRSRSGWGPWWPQSHPNPHCGTESLTQDYSVLC